MTNTYGNITLDGNLNDWSLENRLDYTFNSGVAGYEIYGKLVGDAYVFALKTDGTVISSETTFWLNTDRDRTTGHQIFGFAGGAEYNINFFENKPYLYTGAAGENFISALDYAYNAEQNIIEFAVPISLLGGTSSAVDVYIDVNNTVFAPQDYSNSSYTIDPNKVLPARTDFSKKVGIVFSETTAQNFFDPKAYAQLFMSMQYQAMMAGVPFDLLTEEDLTDINKIKDYDALIFPSFRNVATDKLAAIENNLTDAVYHYHISLITAGDFLTNDASNNVLPGDPYRRMKQLLDVNRVGGTNSANITLKASDVSHPVMADYQANETIRSYTGIGTNIFATGQASGTVLATQEINGQTANAVIATQTGGRNVHFASESFLGDNNLVWQALEWAVYDQQPTVRLNLSRDASIFVSRNDIDQSQYADEVSTVETKLTKIYQDWKQNYNFVGSDYINIGNNSAVGEYTDWNVARAIYQSWLDLGHEIGTHSYTHPDFTYNLTPEQLEFEFNQSQLIIEKQLGINVTGAAIPGNPENLYVNQQLTSYFDYVTGGNSAVGAGYPGAFGFMFPDKDYIYFAPNISSDFALIGFKQLSATAAGAEWLKQYTETVSHTSQAIVFFPWHDYGVTESEPGYARQPYETLLSKAYNDNTEFVTVNELSQRIKTFERSQLTVDRNGNQIVANVIADDLGAFSLNVTDHGTIQNVENWYAYDQDTVFLPVNGGQFKINLGTTADLVTHIVDLPMRAELIGVNGNGTDLQYQFFGEGEVVINLNTPQGYSVVTQGADRVQVTGDRLTMSFNQLGYHNASISFVQKPYQVLVEAESMNLSTYRVENNQLASNANAISLVGGGWFETGTAKYNFTGIAGTYDLVIGYYDENDGIAKLSVQQNNQLLDAWNLDRNLGSNLPDQKTFATRTIARAISVKQGDSFTLTGKESLSEYARVDYFKFIPTEPRIRIEAESMNLSNYRVEANSIASNGKVISLVGGAYPETGTANFIFQGKTGSYNIIVGYYDENDGIANFSIKKGTTTLNSWQANLNLGSSLPTEQTLITKTVASNISLTQGDTFSLIGKENLSEYARFDYVEFVANNNLI